MLLTEGDNQNERPDTTVLTHRKYILTESTHRKISLFSTLYSFKNMCAHALTCIRVHTHTNTPYFTNF